LIVILMLVPRVFIWLWGWLRRRRRERTCGFPVSVAGGERNVVAVAVERLLP
jgi:hypothetical protein